MRLVDGAEAIRGDLPAAATVTVEVPSEAGSDEGSGVQRLSALRAIRDAQLAAMHGAAGLPITIGGDCGVALGAIESAAREDERLAVVWFDAHPDLNTPDSSRHGAFTGMTLRTLLGDGASALVPAVPISADRVILAGARSFDDAESDYLASAPIVGLTPEDLDAESITEALRRSGATSVYLHIDVDVLDPAELAGVGDPIPFGLSLPQLLEAITAARSLLPLAGAGISGFAPSSPEAAADDLGAILRIVGALTR